MLNLDNMVKRVVYFDRIEAEKAIKDLTYFKIDEFDAAHKEAVVRGFDFQYDGLRDQCGFKIGCIQK